MSEAKKKATSKKEVKPVEAAPAIEPKVEPKVEIKTEPKAPRNAYVWYESREREPSQFNVCGYKSFRNFSNGRIEFKIPVDDVARFESNHFVSNGRVVRKANS